MAVKNLDLKSDSLSLTFISSVTSPCLNFLGCKMERIVILTNRLVMRIK